MSDQQQALPLDDQSSTAPSKPPQEHLVEVKGVRLKHFERVLIKLLPHVEPRYVPLPSSAIPSTCTTWPPWDHHLPPAARVYGTLPGQLSNRQRATRKEDQLTSMMHCIVALMITKSGQASCTIVDFGGGSGHLSIPLALLLPHCNVVVVDLKQKSLDFLQEKAKACAQQLNENNNDNRQPQQLSNCRDADSTGQESSVQQPKTESPPNILPTAISNLYTFAGDIESYPNTFDIGVALHVCGEATDVVLRKCASHKAHLVVAPCCVGKLSRQKKDPYIYHATNQNTPTIQYPQSRRFQQCLQCATDTTTSTTTINNNDWDALAKAADYNHELDMKDRRNAARRTAKGLLELDRQLFLRDCYPAYRTALTRMQPLTASPKHDILIGYYSEEDNTREDTNKLPTWMCDREGSLEDPVVVWTRAHLLHPGASSPFAQTSNSNGSSPVMTTGASNEQQRPASGDTIQNWQDNSSSNIKADGVDWTWQEEQEIRAQLRARFPEVSMPWVKEDGTCSSKERERENHKSTGVDSTYVFPSGMGRRKRKMIHFVANELGLAHFCVGKKQSEKTVAVRRRYVKAK